MALFETTAPDCFDNRACFTNTLWASDERTEPEAESKAEAVDSKKAYENKESVLPPISNKFHIGLGNPF